MNCSLYRNKQIIFQKINQKAFQTGEYTSIAKNEFDVTKNDENLAQDSFELYFQFILTLQLKILHYQKQ